MAHRSAMTKTSRFKAIGDIIAELRKVVWLRRREVVYLTFMVLVVTLAVGVILGATDYGFSKLVNNVFLGQ